MADPIAEALVVLRSAKALAGDARLALDSLPDDPGTLAGASLDRVRFAVSAIQAQHLELAHLLLQVERRQKVFDAMRFEHPVYWRTTGSGTREGPFCPTCWEAKQLVSTLTNLPFRGHDRWVCRVCSKTAFSDGAKAAMDAAGLSARFRKHAPGSGVDLDE